LFMLKAFGIDSFNKHKADVWCEQAPEPRYGTLSIKGGGHQVGLRSSDKWIMQWYTKACVHVYIRICKQS
jgi:hypothetical protein